MENTANHKNTGRTFVQMFIFITGNVVYVMDFILYLCIMSKCFFDGGRNILWQHMHDICALC